MRRKLDRHGLRETLHGVFRRTIDGTAGGPDMTHLRGDINDRAGKFSLNQTQGHGLSHEICRPHIECKDRIEILDRDVAEVGRPIVPALLIRI